MTTASAQTMAGARGGAAAGRRSESASARRFGLQPHRAAEVPGPRDHRLRCPARRLVARGRLDLAKDIFLPSPSEVGGPGSRRPDGTLWEDARTSIGRITVGFRIATAMAVPIGVLIGIYRVCRGGDRAAGRLHPLHAGGRLRAADDHLDWDRRAQKLRSSSSAPSSSRCCWSWTTSSGCRATSSTSAHAGDEGPRILPRIVVLPAARRRSGTRCGSRSAGPGPSSWWPSWWRRPRGLGLPDLVAQRFFQTETIFIGISSFSGCLA